MKSWLPFISKLKKGAPGDADGATPGEYEEPETEDPNFTPEEQKMYDDEMALEKEETFRKSERYYEE